MEHREETSDNKLSEKSNDCGSTKGVSLPGNEGNDAENNVPASDSFDKNHGSEKCCEEIADTVQHSQNSMSESVRDVEEQKKHCLPETLKESLISKKLPTGTNRDSENICADVNISVGESAVEKDVDSKVNSLEVSETVDIRKEESRDTHTNEIQSKSCEEKVQDQLHKDVDEDSMEECHKTSVSLESGIQQGSCENIGKTENVAIHTVKDSLHFAEDEQESVKTKPNNDKKVDKELECCKASIVQNELLQEVAIVVDETDKVQKGVKSGEKDRTLQEEVCATNKDESVKETVDGAAKEEVCPVQEEESAIMRERSLVQDEESVVGREKSIIEGKGYTGKGEEIVFEEDIAEKRERSIDETEKNTVEGESSGLECEGSAIEGASIAIEGESSAVEGESTAVECESSAPEDEGIAVVEESGVVEDERSAIDSECNTVGEDRAIEDEKSVINGSEHALEGEGNIIESESERSIVQEKVSAVTEDKCTVQEGRSPIEGDNRPIIEAEIPIQDEGNLRKETETLHQETEKGDRDEESVIPQKMNVIKGNENSNEPSDDVLKIDNAHEKVNKEPTVAEDTQRFETSDIHSGKSKGEGLISLSNLQSEQVDISNKIICSQLEENGNQSTTVGSEEELIKQNSSSENMTPLESSNQIENAIRENNCSSCDSEIASLSENAAPHVTRNRNNNKQNEDEERSLSETPSLDPKSSESDSQLLQDNANNKLTEIDVQINENDESRCASDEMESTCGTPVDSIAGEIVSNKESLKDHKESSCDVQEAVEFVQIDSDDKDESSQNTLDEREDAVATGRDEKDPIDVTGDDNSKNVDDDDDYNNKNDDDYNSKNDDDYNSKNDDDYNSKNDDDYNSKNDDDYNSKNDDDYNSKNDDDDNSKNDDDDNSKNDDDDNSKNVDDDNSRNDDDDNSKNDDDVVIFQDNNDQEMDADDIVDVDKDDYDDSDLKSSQSLEDAGNVDISEMCETVLEESSPSVLNKNLFEICVSKEVNTNDSEIAEDREILDPGMSSIESEIVRTRDISLLKSALNKNNGSKSVSAEETITADKSPENALLVDDDDEEICIIPDTVPKVMPGQTNPEQKRQKIFSTKKMSEIEDASVSSKDLNKEARGKVEPCKGKRNSKSLDSGDKVREPENSLEIQKDSTETRRTPGRPQRQAAKRAESQIKELAANDEESQESEDGVKVCDSCCKVRTWVTSLKFQENGSEKTKYFCSHDCASAYKRISRIQPTNDVDIASTCAVDTIRKFTRKCAQCASIVNGDERNLSWETMDYCNEDCLGRYQKVLGSQCANCRGTVVATSLGKYCVRFGYDVKQFCCSGCLEEFKKGLKVCSYCQKDISGGTEGFLAPVGDKGQFKDFCTQSCMEKYDQMSNNHPPPVVVQECAVCNHRKVVSMEVLHKKRESKFCSEPCFAAYRFVNGIVTGQCYMCKKFFDKKEVDNYAVYSDDTVHSFCSKTCMNVYILANRKIVPCNWCKVKKYNFDMIKRSLSTGQLLLVCSLNCLALFQVGVNAASSKRVKCDMCGAMNIPQYNLNMSDNTVRNFCNYQCVVQFQEQYTNSVCVETPVPTGTPIRYVLQRRSVPVPQSEVKRDSVAGPKTTSSVALPVISSVQSLASDDSPTQTSPAVATRSSAALKQLDNNSSNNVPQPTPQPPKVVRQIIIRPPPPKQVRNKSIMCRPPSLTKGTHCRPIVFSKETQTEPTKEKHVLIPVPVPIYVPTPMCLYSSPFPVPVPFPLPVPVPIFIPTTRKSANGIMKEIKRIQDKIPTDPFEAELLMMAEIVAGDKKENSDSESDAADNANGEADAVANAEDTAEANAPEEGRYSPETVDTSNTFGDDMLQMALKMATELEEPTDLEAALTPSTITPQPPAPVEQTNSESEDDPEPVQSVPEVRPQRGGRKRTLRSRQSTLPPTPPAATQVPKRRRVSSSTEAPLLPPPEPPQPVQVEQEKPDANMCLKFTLGVNAWKRWVLTKNAELEKAAASNRKLKLFKTEILQQTADELNYSLCLFVKEVRKPNGQEYAPDTIYYLCLGIQQYLFENGRIDNIFTDPYYEKFTECLDEVAKKFSTLYNDSQYIVTRVEEEHLWESKQLGAHSPHVLLSTLMFFNTKHFNLTTVEEHMQLSFSHIMKHWKRNPSQSGSSKGPGSSRNVLLRFYPPQSALDANSKKKKVYEQQENEENPLRCPVKLYEFYLSKCPESVKTRNDVFYLLPERSCVPDSPVWYSTMALGKEPLMKMLHRVKMVKEINQALLKS